ncbi:5-oxoprolinase subunit PxpB [Lysobacter sp. SG-8]|uniref:5-oxoprolinase subunit PxpB n=1 Tax=Marilutibacter penaei TaxID=2759900 RepID=A0A7W3U1W8_9GAMM|nr:5-oxoprolinase subunit PxpB [Lysobacter penaei]MBB1087456.1 5-oxoprolinase subunit PxpB [Lysobacter penaei]
MGERPGRPRVSWLSDDALCVTLGDGIDDATIARVHALATQLAATRPAGVLDLVPAYASVGVFFDADGIGPDRVCAWLRSELERDAPVSAPADARVVDVPVCYGGTLGPDLDDASRALGMSPGTLIERHAAGDYAVAMIGFAPGFPYLSGLDPALALPRLATPRTCIPAGSVAIGGAQTGIYPRDSPGGWQILGRTPLRLFDPSRPQPALLQPGDRVRFRPVDEDTFRAIAGAER